MAGLQLTGRHHLQGTGLCQQRIRDHLHAHPLERPGAPVEGRGSHNPLEVQPIGVCAPGPTPLDASPHPRTNCTAPSSRKPGPGSLPLGLCRHPQTGEWLHSPKREMGQCRPAPR